MEKLVVHQLINEKYIGIITILDYEIRLRNYLSKVSFPPSENNIRKVVVDLALKSGINQYRFIAFNVDKNGDIIWESNMYVDVSTDIQNSANRFLQERRDIVLNSVLTEFQKNEILKQ